MILNTSGINSMVTDKQINLYKQRLQAPWFLQDKPLDTYIIVDGYLMHRDAHTRIGGMKNGSHKLSEFRDCILDNLSRWHDFAESYNIIYTLIASNLISYYCSATLLPWEDDIDITIRLKDWKQLRLLYNSLPVARNLNLHYPELCTTYIPKQIPGHDKLYLAFHRKDPGKLKVVNHGRFDFYDSYKTPSKIRGIDISCAVPYHEFGYIESFWAYRRFFPVCPGPGDSMSSNECPEVNFSGVTTRAILPDYGYPYLINRYGTKWNAMIQPRLINKIKGPIPCEMPSKNNNYKISKLIIESCK